MINIYNAEEIIDWQDKLIGVALLRYIVDHIYNPLISYGTLARKANFASGPRALAPHLGNLSKFCQLNGLPKISAVVINETGIPGNGYFDYFYGTISDEKKMCVLTKEYNDIVKYKAQLSRLLAWMENDF